MKEARVVEMTGTGAALLLCLLFQVMVPCNARGVLSIKLLSFENRQGRTYEGKCCDPTPQDGAFCRNQCDYVLRLIIAGLGRANDHVFLFNRPLKYDSNDLHFQEHGSDLTLTVLFDSWPKDALVKMNAFFYDYDDFDHTTALVDWFEMELSGDNSPGGVHTLAASGNRQEDKTRLVLEWSRRCDGGSPFGEYDDCDGPTSDWRQWPWADKSTDGDSRPRGNISSNDRGRFLHQDDADKSPSLKSPFRPFSTKKQDRHLDDLVTFYTANPQNRGLRKQSRSEELAEMRKLEALNTGKGNAVVDQGIPKGSFKSSEEEAVLGINSHRLPEQHTKERIGKSRKFVEETGHKSTVTEKSPRQSIRSGIIRSPFVRRSKDTNVRRSEDTNVRRSEDTNVKRSQDTNIKRLQDTKVRRSKDTSSRPEDTNTRRSKDTNVSRSEDTNARRSEDTNVRRSEDTNVRRSKDSSVKMLEDTNVVQEELLSKLSETASVTSTVTAKRDDSPNDARTGMQRTKLRPEVQKSPNRHHTLKVKEHGKQAIKTSDGDRDGSRIDRVTTVSELHNSGNYSGISLKSKPQNTSRLNTGHKNERMNTSEVHTSRLTAEAQNKTRGFARTATHQKQHAVSTTYPSARTDSVTRGGDNNDRTLRAKDINKTIDNTADHRVGHQQEAPDKEIQANKARSATSTVEYGTLPESTTMSFKHPPSLHATAVDRTRTMTTSVAPTPETASNKTIGDPKYSGMKTSEPTSQWPAKTTSSVTNAPQKHSYIGRKQNSETQSKSISNTASLDLTNGNTIKQRGWGPRDNNKFITWIPATPAAMWRPDSKHAHKDSSSDHTASKTRRLNPSVNHKTPHHTQLTIDNTPVKSLALKKKEDNLVPKKSISRKPSIGHVKAKVETKQSKPSIGAPHISQGNRRSRLISRARDTNEKSLGTVLVSRNKKQSKAKKNNERQNESLTKDKRKFSPRSNKQKSAAIKKAKLKPSSTARSGKKALPRPSWPKSRKGNGAKRSKPVNPIIAHTAQKKWLLKQNNKRLNSQNINTLTPKKSSKTDKKTFKKDVETRHISLSTGLQKTTVEIPIQRKTDRESRDTPPKSDKVTRLSSLEHKTTSAQSPQATPASKGQAANVSRGRGKGRLQNKNKRIPVTTEKPQQNANRRIPIERKQLLKTKQKYVSEARSKPEVSRMKKDKPTKDKNKSNKTNSPQRSTGQKVNKRLSPFSPPPSKMKPPRLVQRQTTTPSVTTPTKRQPTPTIKHQGYSSSLKTSSKTYLYSPTSSPAKQASQNLHKDDARDTAGSLKKSVSQNNGDTQIPEKSERNSSHKGYLTSSAMPSTDNKNETHKELPLTNAQLPETSPEVVSAVTTKQTLRMSPTDSSFVTPSDRFHKIQFSPPSKSQKTPGKNYRSPFSPHPDKNNHFSSKPGKFVKIGKSSNSKNTANPSQLNPDNNDQLSNGSPSNRGVINKNDSSLAKFKKNTARKVSPSNQNMATSTVRPPKKSTSQVVTRAHTGKTVVREEVRLAHQESMNNVKTKTLATSTSEMKYSTNTTPFTVNKSTPSLHEKQSPDGTTGAHKIHPHLATMLPENKEYELPGLSTGHSQVKSNKVDAPGRFTKQEKKEEGKRLKFAEGNLKSQEELVSPDLEDSNSDSVTIQHKGDLRQTHYKQNSSSTESLTNTVNTNAKIDSVKIRKQHPEEAELKPKLSPFSPPEKEQRRPAGLKSAKVESSTHNTNSPSNHGSTRNAELYTTSVDITTSFPTMRKGAATSTSAMKSPFSSPPSMKTKAELSQTHKNIKPPQVFDDGFQKSFEKPTKQSGNRMRTDGRIMPTASSSLKDLSSVPSKTKSRTRSKDVKKFVSFKKQKATKTARHSDQNNRRQNFEATSNAFNKSKGLEEEAGSTLSRQEGVAEIPEEETSNTQSRQKGVPETPVSQVSPSSTYSEKRDKKPDNDYVKKRPQSFFKPTYAAAAASGKRYLKPKPPSQLPVEKPVIEQASQRPTNPYTYSKNPFTQKATKAERHWSGTVLNDHAFTSVRPDTPVIDILPLVQTDVQKQETVLLRQSKGKLSSLYTSRKNGTRISSRVADEKRKTAPSLTDVELKQNHKLSSVSATSGSTSRTRAESNRGRERVLEVKTTQKATGANSKRMDRKLLPTVTPKLGTAGLGGKISEAATKNNTRTASAKSQKGKDTDSLRLLKEFNTPNLTTPKPATTQIVTLSQSQTLAPLTGQSSKPQTLEATTASTLKKDAQHQTDILRQMNSETATRGQKDHNLPAKPSSTLKKSSSATIPQSTAVPTLPGYSVIASSLPSRPSPGTVSVQYSSFTLTIHPTTTGKNQSQTGITNSPNTSTNSSTSSQASAKLTSKNPSYFTTSDMTLVKLVAGKQGRLTVPDTLSSTMRGQRQTSVPLHASHMTTTIKTEHSPSSAAVTSKGMASTVHTQHDKMADSSTIQNHLLTTTEIRSSFPAASVTSPSSHTPSASNTLSSVYRNTSTRSLSEKAENSTLNSPVAWVVNLSTTASEMIRNYSDTRATKLQSRVTIGTETNTTDTPNDTLSQPAAKSEQNPVLSSVQNMSAPVDISQEDNGNKSVNVTTVFSTPVTATNTTLSTILVNVKNSVNGSGGLIPTMVPVSTKQSTTAEKGRPSYSNSNEKTTPIPDNTEPTDVYTTTPQAGNEKSQKPSFITRFTSRPSSDTTTLSASTLSSSSDVSTSMTKKTTAATTSSPVQSTTPQKLLLTLPAWLTFPNKFKDMMNTGSDMIRSTSVTKLPVPAVSKASTVSPTSLSPNNLLSTGRSIEHSSQKVTDTNPKVSDSKPVFTTKFVTKVSQEKSTAKNLTRKTLTEKTSLKKVELNDLLPKDILSKLHGLYTDKNKNLGNADNVMTNTGDKQTTPNKGVTDNNGQKSTDKHPDVFATPHILGDLQNRAEAGPKVMVPKKGLFVPRFFHHNDNLTQQETRESGSGARHVSMHAKHMSLETVFSRYWPAILGLTVGTVFLVAALLTSLACRQQRLFVHRRQGWQHDSPQHLTTPPDTSIYSSSASSLVSDNTRSSVHLT